MLYSESIKYEHVIKSYVFSYSCATNAYSPFLKKLNYYNLKLPYSMNSPPVNSDPGVSAVGLANFSKISPTWTKFHELLKLYKKSCLTKII